MKLRQELSIGHSSLFVQEMTIGGMIGFIIVGLVIEGSGGLVLGSSAIGGRGEETGSLPDIIGSLGGAGVISASGGRGVDGVSIAMATHLIVGFPVVPGGHRHDGRLLMVLHSALKPHKPT